MKKNMIKAAVLLVTAALTIGSCTGPEGPMGPAGATGAAGAKGEDGAKGDNGITVNSGGTVIQITVPPGGGDLAGLKQAIKEQIATLTGGTNDGTTEAKKITVQVNSNFDIEDPFSMFYLYQAIEGLYVDLDLSQVKGTMFSYSSLAAGYKKDKILSVTLGSNVKTIADGTSSTNAFQGFTGMKSITANGVTNVGAYAFFGCTSLVTVSLAAAQTIGTTAFWNCTSLVTVSLAAAQTIGNTAFQNCTSLSTVNLGATAPKLGISIFSSINTTQTVTVKVPSTTTDSAGYGTFSGNTITSSDWIDAFKGRGWDGSQFISNYISPYITLTVVKENS